MKNYFLLLIVYVSFLNGSSDRELFVQGNQFFEQGNFSAAIEKYSAIEKPSAFVIMNQGVAYFNSEQYAQARLHFARVQNMGSIRLYWQAKLYDNRIDDRLQISKEKTTLDTINDYFSAIPLSWLQILIMICFLFVFYRLYQKKKCCSGLWVYLLLLLFIVLWAVRYKQNRSIKAVVIEQGDLYVGPDRSFLKKSVVPLGSVVFVRRQQENMVEIIVDKQRGWIFSNNLTFI